MDHTEHELIERELRDVLTSDRRKLSPDLVTIEGVHRGAVRRRRRRTAASVVAVVLVALAVPATQVLVGNSDTPRPVEGAATQSPKSAATATATAPVSETPPPTPSATGDIGPAWDDAAVLSVTATSEKTFIVLGGCRSGGCVRLAQTTDGGTEFTTLAVPDGVVPGGEDPTPSSAHDVRFGSASDGWLFGDGLWSTHDGGASWVSQQLPGRVQRLEAAAGTVWALVTDPKKGVETSLWRSPVGTDDWTQVPEVSLRNGVDLSVQGPHVVTIGSPDSKAWVGDDGKFVEAQNPCPGGTGSIRLSAAGSLWAACGTGTAAQLLTSADGAAWQQVVPQFLPDSLPNQTMVGARTAREAVLALGQADPFFRVQPDGSGSAVQESPTGGATSYIGFTSNRVGYAITNNRLWRTEDGGNTWVRVGIG